MRYYPINLDVQGRSCLVVGGGAVGTRKVGTLLACGARVTVVSLEVTPALSDLAAEGRILLERRAYQAADVEGRFLVIGATNDETLNRRVHADAEGCGCLCNIADRPALCNFILPAIVQQGDLTVAISTSGKSPAFAKHVRLQIESLFGPEYGVFLTLMGAIRTRLLAEDHAPEAHKPIFERLIQSDLPALIKAKNNDAINRILDTVLGPGFVFEQLTAVSSHPLE